MSTPVRRANVGGTAVVVAEEHLLPDRAGLDLGSAAKPWRRLFVETAIPTGGAAAFDSLDVAGTVTALRFAGRLVNALAFGTYLTASAASYNNSAAVTVAVDATSANTASKVVARDASGNFAAGTITATLNGNASSASSVAASGVTAGTFGAGDYVFPSDLTVTDTLVVGADPGGTDRLRVGGVTLMRQDVSTGGGLSWPLLLKNLDTTASTLHAVGAQAYFKDTGGTEHLAGQWMFRKHEEATIGNTWNTTAANRDVEFSIGMLQGANGFLTDFFLLNTDPFPTRTSMRLRTGTGYFGFAVHDAAAGSDGTKIGTFGTLHYSSDLYTGEEPVVGMRVSSTASVNRLSLGGNSPVGNTITNGELYAAANQTTLTGTKVAEWDVSAVFPGADNAFTMGKTATRWSTIYGYTGNFATEVVTPSVDSGSATDLLLQRNNVTQLTLGSLLATFAGDVNVASGKVYKVNGTQVVAARDTGWTAQTATPSKADLGASPTVGALAQWAAAIQAALTTHGLVGA